jgi:HSP20 family molecular chaperone IbpA
MADSSRSIETAEDTPQLESHWPGMTFTPGVDIYENEKELLLLCDIPGTQSESIQLRFDKGALQLHGHVQQRQSTQGYLLNEYGVGDYYHSFAISKDIDADNIQAEYRLGVLTVHLPKKEANKPRQITIKAG